MAKKPTRHGIAIGALAVMVSGSWSWNLVYHDFKAQSGPGSYGQELDGSLGTKFGDKLGLLLKAAKFEADDAPFVDTTKLWVMFSFDL